MRKTTFSIEKRNENSKIEIIKYHTKLYAVSILKNLARKNRIRKSSSVRGGTQRPRSAKALENSLCLILLR